jgi:hypothetical protein
MISTTRTIAAVATTIRMTTSSPKCALGAGDPVIPL